MYAGEWIHGEGTFSEPTASAGGAGKIKRAAVCIGPEHGTVGALLIKEAAKEAVKGVGFDVLIVCGFAFDPAVSEEAKRYGKLVVLPTKMNPDLAMGDELLKKTGAGNLFMVFGEPDVEIRPHSRRSDGASSSSKSRGWTCTTRPPARFAAPRPTTSPAGSSTPITTARASSCATPTSRGADEPYDKLKRALRADIDEAAWSSLYSTVSRPFDRARIGQDRREGHQPLRRRGAEGLGRRDEAAEVKTSDDWK